jgi:hypothetical protein
MNNPLATRIATRTANRIATPSVVILRASDKDARRISTSTSATNGAHAHSPVRAQHCCAPCPQDLNHMARHV